MSGLLTTAQAAERMGCSQQWVQSLIARKKLKAEKLGGVYLIRESVVDSYQHQPPGRPSTKKANGKKTKVARSRQK